MPQIIKTYTRCEFDDEHGESVPAMDGTYDDLYRDGARWNRRYNAYVEPPTDPDERREAELDFLTKKLRQAKQRYTALRNDVIENLGHVEKGLAVAPPDDRDFDALKRMAGAIGEIESELAKLKPVRNDDLGSAIARAKEGERRKRSAEARVRLSDLPRFED
ncbi:hypothetical protein [Planctomycetes bacterium TBK1r]|uniref:Uncharacterized protein n=1 Tax=Stieleria magnilauensis TaxID=2527963 RepID=A0ABX5XZP1_9BACT|nr:hypothetical protein TBK1r_61910 [Planctomycetes bacterium TBK1r]